MFSLEKEHIIFTHAHKGELLELQQKIAENADLLTLKASNGSSLLMFAAQQGHNRVVEWLVDNGAKLDDKASNIYTALMLAAFAARVTTVKYLLNKGAAAPEQREFWLYTAANAHSNIMKWMCRKAVDWQIKGITTNELLPTKLSKRIYKVADFTVVLPYLQANQIDLLVKNLKYPTVLKNIRIRNFAVVWNYLVPAQQEALVGAFQKQLPQLIDQAQKKKRYAMSLWESLTPEQRAVWLTTYEQPNETKRSKVRLQSFTINQAEAPKEEATVIDDISNFEELSISIYNKDKAQCAAAVTFFASAKTAEVPAEKTYEPRLEPNIN